MALLLVHLELKQLHARRARVFQPRRPDAYGPATDMQCSPLLRMTTIQSSTKSDCSWYHGKLQQQLPLPVVTTFV